MVEMGDDETGAEARMEAAAEAIRGAVLRLLSAEPGWGIRDP